VASANHTTPTRRAIVDLLKWHGPMTVTALGAELGVSAVAVRRHLEGLERDGLVSQAARSGGRGRPAHVFQLSPAGHELFPRNYGQLVAQLLQAAAAEFGPDAVIKLFASRQRAMAANLAHGRGPAGGPLPEVAERLAEVQDAAGYMAEAVPAPGEPGAFTLREHNCPIPAVAASHPVACVAELALLRELAGPGVEVERVEHMPAGDDVCAYRLRATSGQE
jgi:predicted ArsR family transcriptional regulator